MHKQGCTSSYQAKRRSTRCWHLTGQQTQMSCTPTCSYLAFPKNIHNVDVAAEFIYFDVVVS
jgi:hypothetical protein